MNLVQIQRTSTVEQLLNNALTEIDDRTSSVSKQIENALQSSTANQYIQASVILDAYKVAGKGKYLHEILAGCDLFVPPYVKPERSPELQERVERLEAEQANREYREMTKNVDFNRYHAQPTGSSFIPDMKSVQGQLITVVNVFLTIMGAFTFGYKVVEYSTGVKDFVLQICCGLFCAFLVAVADLYFLFKRFNTIE